jgi:hypothetical protein
MHNIYITNLDICVFVSLVFWLAFSATLFNVLRPCLAIVLVVLPLPCGSSDKKATWFRLVAFGHVLDLGVAFRLLVRRPTG